MMRNGKMLCPRDSGRYISSVSEHVFVVDSEISAAAKNIFERMKEEKYSFASWKQWPLHPKLLNKETADWIFVVDCLNFSFWLPGEKQFQLEFNGVVYEDYEALCAAINRAVDEGIAITTPSYYKDISLETVRHVFRSCNGTTLPLLEKRKKNLNEAGSVLCRHYEGSFSNMLLECKGDAMYLLENIVNHFSSFQDVCTFGEQAVSFYKRVQILIADTWACFEGKGYGNFQNISELTMFADYRVPQSLLALKVLKYTDELMDKLRRNVTLDSGCQEEMEIRGCSIHAVECLREEIEKLMRKEDSIYTINSIIIDFYLWDYATRNVGKMKNYPEHKTRSIYY